MWIDLLRGYQTLRRNRIVIKVAFRFVKKHAMRLLGYEVGYTSAKQNFYRV